MNHSIRTHGKCILAGEHGVVRGGEALVFPLHSRSLELCWKPNATGNMQVAPGPFAQPFASAWQRALEITGFSQRLGAELTITSDIPVQAGLGSSAALSVALVRLLESLGARIENTFELALEIENLFHGKSSGIDVACVLSPSPILYRKNLAPQPLPLAWRPHLYLLDSGARSCTKDCVEKVERASRPDLDKRMENAVQAAKSALASKNAGREEALAEAMKMAASCFTEWDLGMSSALENKLLQAGALAVKPTGSGGGGFLLSLWKTKPPLELGLIPVWADSSGEL